MQIETGSLVITNDSRKFLIVGILDSFGDCFSKNVKSNDDSKEIHLFDLQTYKKIPCQFSMIRKNMLWEGVYIQKIVPKKNVQINFDVRDKNEGVI